MKIKNSRILITGGAGFIGSNFILYMLKKYPGLKITNLDKLTYAGNLENLRSVAKDQRYKFIKGDICDRKIVEKAMKDCDIVVHFAAESIPESVYLPVQSTPSIGTRLLTFGELWKEQSKNNKPKKNSQGEAIFLRGKQTKALSFLNGGQWMPIRAITRHWYDGKIIKLNQKWGAIEATPNHSIYSANLELTNPEANPELLAVRGINEIRKKGGRTTNDLLKILAAYITEGNTTFNKANGGYITEISQGDKEWLGDIKGSIKKEFGLNSCIIRHKKKNFKDVYALQISDKIFFNYLVNNCGKYCSEKCFPDWIFDLETKKREFFWEKLLEGDGTKDGRYTTTSYKLANQIGLLLTLQKKEFTVFEYDRKNSKRSWEYKTGLAGQHHGLNQRKKTEVDYKGWVYDLEVEKTHNFICGIGNIVCHNTHVDRSISGPAIFVQTNVIGTQVLLDVAKEKNIKRFHHISTDEVFGALPLDKSKMRFGEKTPYSPHSPYSASKAASDHLVRAYFDTFDLPTTISNCSNNYGPFHFPEKVIPLFITNAMQDKPLPIYGRGKAVRDYLYVTDHCSAIDLILQKGKAGETYCVGGDSEKNGVEVADTILDALGKPSSLKTFVEDRRGHDMRYAIDHSKITRELGWKPSVSFEEGIKKTIDWYCQNELWWKRIISGEYLDEQRQNANLK
jgi:dTDP-glucose 4,6-dehydratase